MRTKGPIAGFLVTAAILLSAAPAAATHSVICKENVSVCPEAATYPAKTLITSAVGFTGTFAEFELTGFVTISSCPAGKFSGRVSPNAEGPSTGSLQQFFFSSCQSPEGCAVTSEGEFPWEWTATGGGDGVIAVSNPWLTAACAKFPYNFSCKYSASALNAEFEGSTALETAFIRSEGTSMSLVGGSGCLASKANLRFRTSVREPWPLFLTN